jgi:urease accessory protein
VVVNTAGGMAGGDRYAIDITVESAARLVVTSAAAEKVYRTHGPDTHVDVTVTVAAGGAVTWIPQETILFDRARLRRTIDVDLAGDASLVLAEAVVFGRSGMGERVVEGLLHDHWRVRRGGRLLYADTVRLDGAIADTLASPAVANGGVAIATVVIVPGDERTADAMRALGAFSGEVGVSAWKGLVAVRMVADNGANLRRDLAAVLRELRGTALPRLWLN